MLLVLVMLLVDCGCGDCLFVVFGYFCCLRILCCVCLVDCLCEFLIRGMVNSVGDFAFFYGLYSCLFGFVCLWFCICGLLRPLLFICLCLCLGLCLWFVLFAYFFSLAYLVDCWFLCCDCFAGCTACGYVTRNLFFVLLFDFW